jgi:hypothetical protein
LVIRFRLKAHPTYAGATIEEFGRPTLIDGVRFAADDIVIRWPTGWGPFPNGRAMFHERGYLQHWEPDPSPDPEARPGAHRRRALARHRPLPADGITPAVVGGNPELNPVHEALAIEWSETVDGVLLLHASFDGEHLEWLAVGWDGRLRFRLVLDADSDPWHLPDVLENVLWPTAREVAVVGGRDALVRICAATFLTTAMVPWSRVRALDAPPAPRRSRR